MNVPSRDQLKPTRGEKLYLHFICTHANNLQIYCKHLHNICIACVFIFARVSLHLLCSYLYMLANVIVYLRSNYVMCKCSRKVQVCDKLANIFTYVFSILHALKKMFNRINGASIINWNLRKTKATYL